MSNSKFDKFLAIDLETSGISFTTDDPSNNYEYQIVSIALIASNTSTYTEDAVLYREIKWNGESKWDTNKVIDFVKENGGGNNADNANEKMSALLHKIRTGGKARIIKCFGPLLLFSAFIAFNIDIIGCKCFTERCNGIAHTNYSCAASDKLLHKRVKPYCQR